jgi:hypothetical protein
MFVKVKRDPASKVRAFIDDAMDEETYVPSDLAQRLVNKLREEEPQLLADWLDAQAVDIMRDTINRINQGRRSMVQHRSKGSVFKDAVKRAEAGEPQLLEGWLDQQYPSGLTNARKALGDMYREEVLYAANIHARLARGNQMQAAFLNVIANGLGARQVREVWDNDKLSTAWKNLDAEEV